MSTLKSALSLMALAAGLSLLAGSPVDAKAHCRTKVVLVKKVVCDCGPAHPARARARAVVRRTVHASHVAIRHTATAHHTETQTAWREPPYPGRPAGVVYVDESSPPIYGGNRFVSTGAMMASSATYSRTVRITRSYGGAPDCGPCAGGPPVDMTGEVNDGIYDGGVGYDGGGYGGGGGGYYSSGMGYGGFAPVYGAFRGMGRGYASASAHAGANVSYHSSSSYHSGGGYGGGHMGGGHMGGGHMGGHGGHW